MENQTLFGEIIILGENRKFMRKLNTFWEKTEVSLNNFNNILQNNREIILKNEKNVMKIKNNFERNITKLRKSVLHLMILEKI